MGDSSSRRVVEIEIPSDLKDEAWYAYQWRSRCWNVWGPGSAIPGTPLHALATDYFKFDRPDKPGSPHPCLHVWLDGRVRIQFVGTFPSADVALSALRARRSPPLGATP